MARHNDPPCQFDAAPGSLAMAGYWRLHRLETMNGLLSPLCPVMQASDLYWGPISVVYGVPRHCHCP